MEDGTASRCGLHGGQCGQCEFCRRGDFFACRYAQTTGFTYDVGYADYMIASTGALASIPDNFQLPKLHR